MIILSEQTTAVQQVESAQQVQVVQTETVASTSTTEVAVVLAEVSSIVVETPRDSVVVSGMLGPPGKDGIAEEDIVYAKRIDFVGENLIYKAEAEVGSLEAAPVWRIRKIDILGDSDIVERWAEGTAAFDKAWTDRATYTYL